MTGLRNSGAPLATAAFALLIGWNAETLLSQAEPKVRLRTGMSQEWQPQSIEEMTKGAAVVLRARLTNRRSYLHTVREGVDAVRQAAVNDLLKRIQSAQTTVK